MTRSNSEVSLRSLTPTYLCGDVLHQYTLNRYRRHEVFNLPATCFYNACRRASFCCALELSRTARFSRFRQSEPCLLSSNFHSHMSVSTPHGLPSRIFTTNFIDIPISIRRSGPHFDVEILALSLVCFSILETRPSGIGSWLVLLVNLPA